MQYSGTRIEFLKIKIKNIVNKNSWYNSCSVFNFHQISELNHSVASDLKLFVPLHFHRVDDTRRVQALSVGSEVDGDWILQEETKNRMSGDVQQTGAALPLAGSRLRYTFCPGAMLPNARLSAFFVLRLPSSYNALECFCSDPPAIACLCQRLKPATKPRDSRYVPIPSSSHAVYNDNLYPLLCTTSYCNLWSRFDVFMNRRNMYLCNGRY